MLKSSGLTTDYINILDRKTTLKKRILAGKQQLLRIDTEDASPLNLDEGKQVLDAFTRASKGIGAIVISDYAKGILTKNVLNTIGEFAKLHSIPVLADLKLSNLNKASNISILKINLSKLHNTLELPTVVKSLKLQKWLISFIRVFHAR